MQCSVPANCADFSCYNKGGDEYSDTPHTEVWVDKTDTTKTGLLGTASAANNSKTFMDFETLNNKTARDTWLNNAYTALQTSKVIPEPPVDDTINNIVEGNLHGIPAIDPYLANVATFQTRLQDEYCFYQKRYFVAVTSFLNNYKDTTEKNNTIILPEKQESALICNNKLNTLIAWMNYLSAKQRLNLTVLDTSIKGQDQSLTDISDKLTAQAAIFNTNNNSSLVYKEMVNFTSEKNQAHQNLLALYFTLNVVAIASLFVIAKVL